MAGSVAVTYGQNYSGTLQAGTASSVGTIGTGNVSNAGTLMFGGATTSAVPNSISGTGLVLQAGTGQTQLGGTLTHTGGTTVVAGSLQVGNGTTSGSLAGNVVTVTGTSVLMNRSDDTTYAGIISGEGAFTKLGAGQLTLTGANSYTGITTISAGALQVGTGGTAGALGTGVVTNNGGLIFNRSDAVNVANAHLFL